MLRSVAFGLWHLRRFYCNVICCVSAGRLRTGAGWYSDCGKGHHGYANSLHFVLLTIWSWLFSVCNHKMVVKRGGNGAATW